MIFKMGTFSNLQLTQPEHLKGAHIPPEIGFALGTNANEIYTKNMKYTWPTPAFCVGTQRQLYSTDWRRGLASGLTQILGLASGVWRRETQIFTFKSPPPPLRMGYTWSYMMQYRVSCVYDLRYVGRIFQEVCVWGGGGVLLNAIFLKGSFCTDLPNTL